MPRMLGDAFIVISPLTDDFGAKAEAGIKKQLAGIHPEVKIGADVSAVPAAVTALMTKLKQLSQGRVAFADLIDINVPQGQIVTQLLLLKRLIQHAGLADMLGVNLNEAQIRQQLQKIASLSETINVGANTGGAQTAIATLEGELAGLDLKLSRLTASLNDTDAMAKISELEQMATALYDQLDHLTADVNVTDVLTKIYDVEAELKTLNADAGVVRLRADITGVTSAIATVESKLAALKAISETISIGASADTSGATAALAQLAAAEKNAGTNASDSAAQLLALAASATTAGDASHFAYAAQVALGAAAGQAGKSAGNAGRQFGNFGAIVTGTGWGIGVAGISAIHLAIDGVIEAAIVAVSSLAALGVAAAVTYKAFDQLGIYINSSLNAMTALGVDAGPLAGKLDAIQKAMAPQTIEAYGGALNLVANQTGLFNKLGRQVVDMLDGMIARIDLWASGQKNLSGIIESGIGYLAQLGKILGTIGQALDNLLTKDPGIARFLLDFVQGIADVIKVFSELPAPIVTATLALHGLYLWSKVLIVAPLLSFAAGLGILSKAQADTAKSAITLRGALSLLAAGNPYAWAVLAAAAIGGLVYELSQASPAAKAFISALNTGLAQDTASQAIVQISVDVGELRAQIQATQASSGKLVTGLLDTASSSKSFFSQALHDAPLSNAQFTDLGKSVLNAAKAFFGFQSAGAIIRQNTNSVGAYTGEIVKLSAEQTNLFKITGQLVTGQLKLGIGTVSVSQAFALLNLAGVQAGDRFDVMVQKVKNLVTGYQAMSVSSGILNNSINALTFSTLQQDSKVTQLNSAWDTFFSTVTGGSTSFLSFVQQTNGLYQALTASGSTLTDSNGRVSATLTGLAKAAGSTTISMTGLNSASVTAQQTFLQSASAANSQLDALTLLASAAGLGAKGTSLLTQATQAMVAALLPATGGSQQLTTALYALAQRGGYQGADSFKALSAWVAKTQNPMQTLQGIVTTLTVAAGNLTKDVQNLSLALGQTLNQAMSEAIFQATGGQKTFDDFATALLRTGSASTLTQQTGLKLAQQLVGLTGNTKDAGNEFIAFATQITGSRTKADLLWQEISQKLTPAISQQSSSTLPTARAAFATWAKSGLDLSRTSANNLWTELTGHLGAELQNLSNSSVPGAKQAFISWAESGLKLTQSQAQSLWGELQTLQSFINGMHGTTITITEHGVGQFQIYGGTTPGSTGGGAPGVPAAARGGRIRHGTGPTADDVLIRVSKGETVVSAAHSKLLAPAFKALGIPGYASGGVPAGGGSVAALLPQTQQFNQNFINTFTAAMEAAMTAAMKSDIAAAQAKAAAAAAAAGGGGGAVANSATIAALAAAHGWTGAQLTALLNVVARESGGSTTATNPTSGAYGIAQFIGGPSEYALYGGNSTTVAGQVTAMLNYISQRYGTPAAAWQHELQYGWYDKGGLLKPGATLAWNGTGRSEAVMPSGGWAGGRDDRILNELRLHNYLLQQLIGTTAAVPARTGEHVGSAISGAASQAHWNHRYASRSW